MTLREKGLNCPHPRVHRITEWINEQQRVRCLPCYLLIKLKNLWAMVVVQLIHPYEHGGRPMKYLIITFQSLYILYPNNNHMFRVYRKPILMPIEGRCIRCGALI